MNKTLISKIQQAVLVGKVPKGHLLWTESEVRKWIESNPSKADKVAQLWKLALFEEYCNKPAAKAFFKAIAGEHGNMQEMEEFLEMHLTRFYEEILDCLSNKHPESPVDVNTARDYWKIMQWETLLMVPAKFSQDPQSIMKSAATKAGFCHVGIVYESLVAVASELYHLEEKHEVKPGLLAANL